MGSVRRPYLIRNKRRIEISEGVIKKSLGPYLFFLAFFLAVFFLAFFLATFFLAVLLFALPGPLYIVISFLLVKWKSFLRLFDDEYI